MAGPMTKPKKQAKEQAPNCLQCAYYHITWDVNFPHGCRAIGFKSKRRPQLDVLQNSGSSCLAFEQRQKPPNPGTSHP